jgi:hypothetical protein
MRRGKRGENRKDKREKRTDKRRDEEDYDYINNIDNYKILNNYLHTFLLFSPGLSCILQNSEYFSFLLPRLLRTCQNGFKFIFSSAA